MAHKNLFARDSAKQARLKEYKNKYPWKFKKNYNSFWVDKAFSFDFEKSQMSLSFGVWNHKQQGVSVDLPKNVIKKIQKILKKDENAVS